MNKNQNELMKQRLLSEKAEILSRKQTNEIDVAGDEIDKIQGSLIASISNHLSSRDAQKLVQIEQALSRIENGAYGTCEDCDEEISEKRLQINPYFSNCVNCAETAERNLRQSKKQ